LHSSKNVITLVKSRGHVARTGEIRTEHKIVVQKPERGRLEDQGNDGRKLKYILLTYGVD
jgi:hypothetical protein